MLDIRYYQSQNQYMHDSYADGLQKKFIKAYQGTIDEFGHRQSGLMLDPIDRHTHNNRIITDASMLFDLAVDLLEQTGRDTKDGAKVAYRTHARYINNTYGPDTAVMDTDSLYLGLTQDAEQKKAVIENPELQNEPPVKRLSKNISDSLLRNPLSNSIVDAHRKASDRIKPYSYENTPEDEATAEASALLKEMYFSSFSDTQTEYYQDRERYRKIAAFITFKYGPICHLGPAAYRNAEGVSYNLPGDTREMGFIGIPR